MVLSVNDTISYNLSTSFCDEDTVWFGNGYSGRLRWEVAALC